MNQFKHAIINPIERFVFCSVSGREDLVQVRGYCGGLDPTVNYMPIKDARNFYRRLMTCGEQYVVTPHTN